VSVVVEGNPRKLNLDVRDDIYRIAREAVRSAYQQANARHIETGVTFGDKGYGSDGSRGSYQLSAFQA
jgi:hypothetical protein